MLKIELTLDEINYDRLFDVYFEKMKATFENCEDPAGRMMARVPDVMAKQIWAGLPVEQKEQIAAGLLEMKAKELQGLGEAKLRQAKVELSVKEIKVRAE